MMVSKMTFDHWSHIALCHMDNKQDLPYYTIQSPLPLDSTRTLSAAPAGWLPVLQFRPEGTCTILASVILDRRVLVTDYQLLDFATPTPGSWPLVLVVISLYRHYNLLKLKVTTSIVLNTIVHTDYCKRKMKRKFINTLDMKKHQSQLQQMLHITTVIRYEVGFPRQATSGTESSTVSHHVGLGPTVQSGNRAYWAWSDFLGQNAPSKLLEPTA
jgi:hypothetical protein